MKHCQQCGKKYADDTRASLEKAVELSNRASIVVSNLGHVYATTGKREEAKTLIKELEEKYVGMNRTDNSSASCMRASAKKTRRSSGSRKISKATTESCRRSIGLMASGH